MSCFGCLCLRPVMLKQQQAGTGMQRGRRARAELSAVGTVSPTMLALILQAFTAGQIVELMQEACVNEQLVLQVSHPACTCGSSTGMICVKGPCRHLKAGASSPMAPPLTTCC